MKTNIINVLLTGSSGFVGSAVAAELVQHPCFNLSLAMRRTTDENLGNSRIIIVPDFCDANTWGKAVEGKDVVIHSAARVHVMKEVSQDSIAAFRKVNVQATVSLAEQAGRAGVKRFIFISSIKVNGESLNRESAYSADDVPRPMDAYGISKYEAEEALKEIGTKWGMEVVIIRPVLIYGPGVKANFYNMMKWIYSGIPLPLRSVKNKRSLLYIGNLVDLIVKCVTHPSAANQIFLASDDEDCSTSELLTYVAESMGKSNKLIPVPEPILRVTATLLGKRDMAERLLGSLVVDIEKTKDLLGWRPPIAVRPAIDNTVEFFLSELKK